MPVPNRLVLHRKASDTTVCAEKSRPLFFILKNCRTFASEFSSSHGPAKRRNPAGTERKENGSLHFEIRDVFCAYFCTLRFYRYFCHPESHADVAQLAEQLICNQLVGGSNPSIGSKEGRKSQTPHHKRGERQKSAENVLTRYGRIPEWPNGADCKSAGLYLRWFESIFSHEAEVALVKADIPDGIPDGIATFTNKRK